MRFNRSRTSQSRHLHKQHANGTIQQQAPGFRTLQHQNTVGKPSGSLRKSRGYPSHLSGGLSCSQKYLFRRSRSTELHSEFLTHAARRSPTLLRSLTRLSGSTASVICLRFIVPLRSTPLRRSFIIGLFVVSMSKCITGPKP